MRNIKIIGYGAYLPDNTLTFNGETRYRCKEGEKQIDLAVNACNLALDKAKLKISDIDCLVSVSAVGIQPIPCTAALIHERIAKETDIPALDINTTCTSFITALDIMSYLIDADRYRRVMIVASEEASVGLNKDDKYTYELFSDGASAMIFEKSDDKNQGIIASMQKTWSVGAHHTEIVGGLTKKHPEYFNELNRKDYYFSMKGMQVISLCAEKLPKMYEEFLKKYNINIDDIDLVIPHQASRALPLIMKRVGISENKFVNMVAMYGNQVSVSVPFMLCKLLDEKRIKKNDKVILSGTAAGLTSNILLIQI